MLLDYCSLTARLVDNGINWEKLKTGETYAVWLSKPPSAADGSPATPPRNVFDTKLEMATLVTLLIAKQATDHDKRIKEKALRTLLFSNKEYPEVLQQGPAE